MERVVRIENDEHLNQLVLFKILLPPPHAVCVDYRLDRKWRYLLPQTVYLLSDLGSEFQDVFGHCFQLNSAIRTIERQLEIKFKEHNRNAAPAFGERRSLHFTGMTIDITKFRLTKEEVKWLREKLLELESSGVLDATEEFGQAVFHVTVFRSYLESAD